MMAKTPATTAAIRPFEFWRKPEGPNLAIRETLAMETGLIVKYARGDAPADLLLKNARVVNVLSGEIIPSHVAIVRLRVVGLGDYQAVETVDLQGSYLAPGFIDAHVHIESSMSPPNEFARAVVPRGTTAVITDPHEIANVLGLDGIRFMFDCAKYGL